MVIDYTDPGWKKPVRGVLLQATVFGMLWKRTRGAKEAMALEKMRSVFLGLVASMWLTLFVLSFVGTYRTPDALVGTASTVVAAGLLSSWRIRALERRLLRARTDRELAVGYQAVFFIQMGLAQLPALVAFILSFFSGSVWVYVIGAVVASLNFWLMAPTRRNIVRMQERINAAGIPSSLGRTLTTRPVGPES